MKFFEAARHIAHRRAAVLCYFSRVPQTRQTLLRKAADLIGRDELASGLKVPVSVLEAWMNGTGIMPARKLSALADLLDKISHPPKH